MNGNLVDGTGNNPMSDAAVLIRENRIIAVGPRAKISIPADVTLLDVLGATILPGFFNAHIHRGYSASNLQAWAQAGVTTVRDLGTSPGASSFTMRDTLLQDNRNARLVAAGPMITVPDGYPMVPWGSSGLIVSSTEDAFAKAKQLLDLRADVLKISLEAGSTFGKRIPVLSADQAAAIVQIAHRRGTRVSAHITANEDLTRVLAGGVDDIAHMAYNPVSDETIRQIVQAGIYWVPTLELWHVVGAGGTTPITNLQHFVAAGGCVALGTDYAGYSGTFDLGMPVHEIDAMHAAGMTPMQIIVAATRNAAHVSNLGTQLGTLEAGKIADILVVDGDPLQDLHALTSVRIVIHNGTVIRGNLPKVSRPTPNLTATLSPPTASPEPPGQVDDGGRTLFYRCEGQGSPTVLLEAGLNEPGATSGTWNAALDQIASATRVCAYDRANLGKSGGAPKPRTSQDIVRDLHALLANAQIAAPYVLIGHSIGGSHVRVYASKYLQELAGLVLVDSSHPDQYARWPAHLPTPFPDEAPALKGLRPFVTLAPEESTSNREGLDILASAAQVRASGHFGSLPLLVLSRSPNANPLNLPSELNAIVDGVWSEMQNEMADLSSNSKHLVAARAGHNIQRDEPAWLAGTILDFVRDIRAGRQ